MENEEGERHFASVDEVKDAIEALTNTDLGKLKRYGQYRIQRVDRAACGRSWRDLLHDAVAATLSGRRHWNKAVDFPRHLFLAMKSISSGWAESLAAEKNEEPVFECELIESTEDGGPLNAFQLAPSSFPSPETAAEARGCIGTIRRFFCKDSLILDILDGWLADMTGPEICEALGITHTQYHSAVRKFERNLPKVRL